MQTDFRTYTRYVALATFLLLLIPFIAMQFSSGVHWSLGDFVVAGTLLFGTGMTYGLISRHAQSTTYRFALGLTLATALLMVWANLAVGLVGSEHEAFNLIYFGLLAVGLLGAFLARLKADGMARTLLAMAVAQVVVTTLAFLLGMHEVPGSSVLEILSVNGFFLILWMVSALLFRRVAEGEMV